MSRSNNPPPGAARRPIRLRFALPPRVPQRTEAERFRAAMLSAGFELEVVASSSYAGLFHAVDSRACDLAWAPPLVALDLARCSAATPLVALIRAHGPGYYGAIVTAERSPRRSLRALAGASIGWVAVESAAGYVVPRLHLQSLGIDPNAFFGRVAFLGSHERALEAVVSGKVDAAATYARYDERARRFVLPPAPAALRLLAAAGPIPEDVIVARSDLPEAVRVRLAVELSRLDDAARASLIPIMNARRLVPARPEHLDALRAFAARADEAALRPWLSRPPGRPASPGAHCQLA